MHIAIFITASSKKEAAKIAQVLIENKLAACVNIIDGIESIFWWQGKVDRAKEALLIVKSSRGRLSALIKVVKALHSYDIPEIIALPITGGNKDYLKWCDESLR